MNTVLIGICLTCEAEHIFNMFEPFAFFFFCFSGPYPWHMEVPRLEAELEL